MRSECAWTLERSEALDGLRSLAEGSVDLVYMDPPFNTGRARRGRTREDSFEDRWPSREHYLEFMRGHFIEAHRVLRDSGSLLVHCDWRTCHHLWVELERVFGTERAVNHLVWSYGLGGSGPRTFARKHDDILFFARGPQYWFEAPRVPSRSRRMAGAPKKATDVIEIPSINNQAHERTGWPSQKPLALMRVLVGACCPPGGLVVDPCCGSGTTVEAAVLLGRRAIGFDRSPRAIEIARRRMVGYEALLRNGATRASISRSRARAASADGATIVT